MNSKTVLSHHQRLNIDYISTIILSSDQSRRRLYAYNNTTPMMSITKERRDDPLKRKKNETEKSAYKQENERATGVENDMSCERDVLSIL